MKAIILCLFAAVCIALVASGPAWKGGNKISAPMDSGCNDTQDLTAFITTNKTFHGLLQACAAKCLGSVSCATPCIQNDVGLTLACATCFANDTHCTMVNCAKYCVVDPNGADCVNCSKQYCFNDLVTCACVNPDVFPQ